MSSPAKRRRRKLIRATAAAIPVLANNSRLVFLGGQWFSTNSTARDVKRWVEILCNGHPYLGPNAISVRSGDKTSDMLARWSRVVGNAPQILVIDTAINDIAAARTAAAILADYDSIFILAAAFGSRIIVLNTPHTSTMSAANDLTRATVNAGLLDRANVNLAVVDVSSIWNGTTTPLYTTTGTLLSRAGAQEAIAPAIAAVINAWSTTTALLPTSGDISAAGNFGANLNTAYDFTGTTGTKAGTVGATGNVGTNWTLTNDITGTTCVAAKHADGSQLVTLTGTGSSATTDCKLTRTVTAAFTAGENYEIIFECVLTGSDGTSDPTGVVVFGATAFSSLLFGITSNTDPYLKTINAVIRSQPIATGAGASSTLQVNFRCAVGTVDVLLKIKRCYVRKCESTAYAVPVDQSTPGDGGATPFTAPTITGTLTVGSVLTCGTPRFSGGGITFSYQWKRGVTSVGSNLRTYTSEAAGSHTCVITATNASGSDTCTTAAVTVV